MMTRTLLIAAAEFVLLAAWVAYARRRARNHRPPPSRHPGRPRTARGIPAGHPDAGFVLTSHERHRLNEVGMDSFVDVPEPDYQTTTGEAS